MRQGGVAALEFVAVLAIGLVAGTVGGIVGFGSSIMLMPVLVLVFGPLEAVPIMAIGSVLANLSRVAAWWREVDWRACAAYAVTGVPAAAAGARTLLVLPPRLTETALGLFFLAMIPLRRWMLAHELRLGLWHLAAVGLVVGYVTGIVVSTGPLTTPAFLAYGLVKGAFIATEAAGSLAVYLSKSVVFRAFGALPVEAIGKGLVVGASLMAGAFVAKRYVVRMDPARFRFLMDGLMAVSGLTLLVAAGFGSTGADGAATAR